MGTYTTHPAAPNQDKRWKLVDATMRRTGKTSRSLIEALHTVQEAFGYIDEESLRYVAMNRSVLQVAEHYVRGDRITDGMLNRVEAVIRAYDPCLSCSTHASGHASGHAAGQMALRVQLLSPDGAVLDEVAR
jgi:NADH:ubiquinone oxidoreductase subunit E